MSIPVSHSLYELITEPWVKCLNTREAYNLISLWFQAVCSWVFFSARDCVLISMLNIFMEFFRAQRHFLERAVFALEDGTQNGCRNTK